MEFKKYLCGVSDAGTRSLLNSSQERMDTMKSWAGIEEGKAGRSVRCVMQSVRVLVNPRRACARVTVVVLCVCVSVCSRSSCFSVR